MVEESGLLFWKHEPKVKRTIFWAVAPCSPLKVNRRFGRTYSLHLQGRWISRARNQRESKWQAEILLGLFFDPEDGDDDMFIRNVGWLSTDCTALYTKRQYSSWAPLSEPQILHELKCLNTKYKEIIWTKEGWVTWPSPTWHCKPPSIESAEDYGGVDMKVGWGVKRRVQNFFWEPPWNM
jgi:hypothetical protein